MNWPAAPQSHAHRRTAGAFTSRSATLRSVARGLALISALAWSFGINARPVLAQTVDLELVLAVDASSSVSSEEFDLQMRGLSEAFRDPRVTEAIQATGDLGIAVAMVQWADNRRQYLAIDWTAIRGEDGAIAFATQIDATPRFVVGGGTAIGGALEFSARALEDNGYQGRRRVIDVSGDGRANQGAQPAYVRDAVVAAGIVINGLAILNEDPFLDSYYQDEVIGGTGAFLVTASTYADFADAILQKLIREIAGVPVAALPPRCARTQVAEASAPGR